MEGMENRRTLRGLVSPGCSDSMQCPSSDVSCSLSKLSNAMQAKTVTRHEYSSVFFFFSLARSTSLFLWYSFALARCRAYPAVPIRRSGNGTGTPSRRPSQVRHMFRE